MKYGENRLNGSKVTAFYLNPRWRRPPSWKQEKCCNFRTVQPISTIFEEKNFTEKIILSYLCNTGTFVQWRRHMGALGARAPSEKLNCRNFEAD